MGLKNWYEANIMPRLITCACSQRQVMKRRSAVVPLAYGDVFELGCGGGINHTFYDAVAITSYAGIDPHEGLLDAARDAARAKGWAADIRAGRGEVIPFAEEQAREAAHLFNAIGRKRHLRVDTMIAATAIVAGAPLATGNREDFQPFLAHGLKLA